MRNSPEVEFILITRSKRATSTAKVSADEGRFVFVLPTVKNASLKKTYNPMLLINDPRKLRELHSIYFKTR